VDDIVSVVLAGLVSPTGLGYSQVLFFEHDMSQSILQGRFVVYHESSESIARLSEELEEEIRFMQHRVDTMLGGSEDRIDRLQNEDDLHWLSGNAQWVTLFQRLNPDNPKSEKLQRLRFNTFPEPNQDGTPSLFEQVIFWKRPRALRKSVLGTALPHALAGFLSEEFIIAPLATSRGLRALLVMDRHLEGHVNYTADDLYELEWFCRQATLAIETIEVNSDLSRAYQELKQVDQMKSNFLSIISHELRTPLTAMTGFLDLLVEGRVGELNENQKTLLTRVAKNTHHLNHLVNDLIELAEIEAAGTLELKRDLVEPLAVLLDTLPKLEQRRREKKVKVIPLIEIEVPRIIADERSLERVFFHLLDNAMKFSSDGSTVEVHFRRDADHLHIDVVDHGVGIAAENIQNIFKYFYQVDNTLTRGHEGLGLGLAVTKMLVQANKGRITVQSEVGRGSTFTVSFPVASPAALREA
jgi:signal transduction histidine kinase